MEAYKGRRHLHSDFIPKVLGCVPHKPADEGPIGMDLI